MNCRACGFAIEDGAFCPMCGARMAPPPRSITIPRVAPQPVAPYPEAASGGVPATPDPPATPAIEVAPFPETPLPAAAPPRPVAPLAATEAAPALPHPPASSGSATLAPGQVAELTILVGRDESATIQILHPTVSGRHAELSYDGDGILLVDLGSKNGTFVNGRRIERMRIPPREPVLVGTVLLPWDHPRLKELALIASPRHAPPDPLPEVRGQPSPREPAVIVSQPPPPSAAASTRRPEPRVTQDQIEGMLRASKTNLTLYFAIGAAVLAAIMLVVVILTRG